MTVPAATRHRVSSARRLLRVVVAGLRRRDHLHAYDDHDSHKSRSHRATNQRLNRFLCRRYTQSRLVSSPRFKLPGRLNELGVLLRGGLLLKVEEQRLQTLEGQLGDSLQASSRHSAASATLTLISDSFSRFSQRVALRRGERGCPLEAGNDRLDQRLLLEISPLAVGGSQFLPLVVSNRPCSDF